MIFKNPKTICIIFLKTIIIKLLVKNYQNISIQLYRQSKQVNCTWLHITSFIVQLFCIIKYELGRYLLQLMVRNKN